MKIAKMWPSWFGKVKDNSEEQQKHRSNYFNKKIGCHLI